MSLEFPYTNDIIGNSLKEDGMYVLPGLVNNDKWANAISCPTGNVNYKLMRVYIDECILEINKTIGWNSVMTKYRVSAGCTFDTSNATDASAFHRDLQQHSESENFPVFTLIVYLDPAELGVIKGSHLKRHMSLLDAITQTTEVLSLAPGDGVLFHASLLHKGLFKKLDSRRVIQCFDIYPTPELADKYSNRIIHIWLDPDSTESEKGIIMAKFTHLWISGIMKYVAYILAAQGYGHKNIVLPNGIEAISGEAWRGRLPHMQESDGEFHSGNLYVIANELYCVDADEENNKIIRNFIYHKIWFDIGVTILIYKILLSVIVIFIYKNRAKVKKLWTNGLKRIRKSSKRIRR
jgi:hypothetical protein|tara:strand:+ start:126 stop:1175 length:1050 start_codon:yes stop_codon:yes gene_type:complete